MLRGEGSRLKHTAEQADQDAVEPKPESMTRVTIDEWVASGSHPELSDIFFAMAEAAAKIAARLRLAGLDDLYGAAGATNVQGEQQQKLDVFANDTVTGFLRQCVDVAGIVSEEDDTPVVFHHGEAAGEPRFVVSFDPLDGSSNIDVNVNVGTIFGVRPLPAGSQDIAAAVARPGAEQVAAGYIVYGPSTVFVATVGDGVASFTLDDQHDFRLSNESMKMPEQGVYYSANEANAESWPAGFRALIPALLRGELGGQPYSARYVGSLVADFHRTLLKGGVFLYPATEKTPEGKLRLQYEANPLAMVAEAAGGAATNGKERVLDLGANGVHDRTAFVVGSRREVELLGRLVVEPRG